MQFGRRIAIHKSVKETNLIKLYFHSYGWFLLLFLNGMLCMIFSYRTLFFFRVISRYYEPLRIASSLFFLLYDLISDTLNAISKHLFYLHCLCCVPFSVLPFFYSARPIFCCFGFFLHDLMDDDTKNMCCVYYSTVIIACVTPNIQSN